MVKSTMSKLVPAVSLPGATRRQQYSASTKRALLEAAQGLFARHGYAGTSLDAIVAGAEVTKGALYHHFSGKQALFEAVFETTESESAERVQREMDGIADPWEQATAGLGAYLAIVQEPAYRRIVIQDGPAVLGYERYRAQEERTTFTVVIELVRSVLREGEHDVDADMTETFARIFCGALTSAGEEVAEATDPTAAAARVQAAIAYILAGLQSLADQGVQLRTS